MNTNQAGVDLIKRYEGLELEAYLCPANVLTIGYGHTGDDVEPGMTIDEHQAEDLLRKDLVRFERAVERLVSVPVNPNEFSALVSLTYNIGEGNFSSSSCLRYLNQGNRQEAANRIELWNKARVGGELTVLEGLVRRRASEKALFLTPVQTDSFSVPTAQVAPEVGAEDAVAAETADTHADLDAVVRQELEQAELQREDENTDKKIASGVTVAATAASGSALTDAADQATPDADVAADIGGLQLAVRDFVDGLPEWLLVSLKLVVIAGLIFVALQLIKRRKARVLAQQLAQFRQNHAGKAPYLRELALTRVRSLPATGSTGSKSANPLAVFAARRLNQKSRDRATRSGA